MATEALGQRRGKNRRHTPAGKMAEALRPAETAHIANPLAMSRLTNAEHAQPH